MISQKKGRLKQVLVLVWLGLLLLLWPLWAAARNVTASRVFASDTGKAIRVYQGAQKDVLYVRLKAGKPSFQKVSRKNPFAREGDVAVGMAGFAIRMSPGDPMLPYQVYQIALPPATVPKSVTFEIIQRIDEPLKGTYHVAPAPPRDRCQSTTPEKKTLPPEEKWGQAKEIAEGRNRKVYTKDALYPVRVCRVSYAGQMRKWKIGSVTFSPLRYNPVTGRLVLTKELDLKISFRQDTAWLATPAAKGLLRDTVFDKRVRPLIKNFDGASKWYRESLIKALKKSGQKANPGQPPDPNFTIVTNETIFSDNIGAAGSLDEFCFHKEDLGFEVMVVTEHTVRTVEHDPASGYSFAVLAGASGYEDVVGAPAPNQRPEKLYKWLKDNYLTYAIEYLLLIGNPDPDNIGAGDPIGELPMKNLMLNPATDTDCPTDFYFAELTGNWDQDGDGNAGEFSDDKGPGGVEFYADLIVGRIPVYDENQDGALEYTPLNGILDKIIAYEDAAMIDVPWRRGVLTTAPYVVDTDGDGVKDTAKYEWSEWLHDGVAPPPVWDWHRIYEEPYAGLTTPAEVDTGCSYDETEDGWNDTADPNNGKGVVMWMTHGLQTFATKAFTNGRCANLDDTKPSIVFMGACHNGEPRFNPPNGIPLGFANLKQGAIATISATRDSYG